MPPPVIVKPFEILSHIFQIPVCIIVEPQIRKHSCLGCNDQRRPQKHDEMLILYFLHF